MVYYKVIGGLKGSYMPFYDSGVLKSKGEARVVLNERKREFENREYKQGLEVYAVTDDKFEVSRPSDTQIDYRYRIVEIDEADVDRGDIHG